MYSALSQKLNNLQLMGSIQPSYETNAAQNSTAKIIIPERVRPVKRKMSFEDSEPTMDSKSQHLTVPITTSGGESKLVSPTQAQASRAKASVKTEHKRCKLEPKVHTISGKGTASGKCKQGKQSKAGKGKCKSTQNKKKSSKKKTSKQSAKKKSAGKAKSKAAASKKGASKKSKPKGKSKKSKGKKG